MELDAVYALRYSGMCYANREAYPMTEPRVPSDRTMIVSERRRLLSPAELRGLIESLGWTPNGHAHNEGRSLGFDSPTGLAKDVRMWHCGPGADDYADYADTVQNALGDLSKLHGHTTAELWDMATKDGDR